MTINRTVFVFVIGVICTIAIFLIFKGCGHTPLVPAIIKPEVLIKEVVKNEGASQKSFDSLTKIVNKTKDSVFNLKTKLKNNRDYASGLENQLEDLKNDSGQHIQYVDVVNDYVDNAKEQNSNCSQLVTVLERQISHQDSMLGIRQRLYSLLRHSFDTATAALSVSNTYSKDLRRALNRKKFGNIVWKSAAIAAGLIILKSVLK